MSKVYLVQSGDRYYGYDSIELALKEQYQSEREVFEVELKSLGNFKLQAVEVKTVITVEGTKDV